VSVNDDLLIMQQRSQLRRDCRATPFDAQKSSAVESLSRRRCKHCIIVTELTDATNVNVIFLTSAKEGMFYRAFLFVCLSVGRISYKVVEE